MKVKIKENSLLAKVAAFQLKEKRVAFVLGSTLHLWNVSRETFLKDQRWLRHEIAHIKQFKQHGFFTFIFLYLKESLKNGYHQNRFEIEARAEENNDIDISGIVFI